MIVLFKDSEKISPQKAPGGQKSGGRPRRRWGSRARPPSPPPAPPPPQDFQTGKQLIEFQENLAAPTSTSISLWRVTASMPRQERRAKPLRARATRTGAGGVMSGWWDEADTTSFDRRLECGRGRDEGRGAYWRHLTPSAQIEFQPPALLTMGGRVSHWQACLTKRLGKQPVLHVNVMSLEKSWFLSTW